MRPRFFRRYFPAVVVAAGIALLATSCSSSPAAPETAAVTPTTNTGLCKLVSPSVVATAISESMSFPETLTHNTTTECVYRSKERTSTAVLVLYETNSNASTFAKNKQRFEQRGLKLGPITGLGDQAYYFREQLGKSSVTTVATTKGSLQLLVTGSATLDQIGSIARYALNQYEVMHSPAPPSN